jgi:hypothetical protein
MSNEAAERLRETLAADGWVEGSLATNQLDLALAAERRATVERIQHEVLFYRNRTGKPSERIPVTALLAILDEEAAR